MDIDDLRILLQCICEHSHTHVYIIRSPMFVTWLARVYGVIFLKANVYWLLVMK